MDAKFWKEKNPPKDYTGEDLLKMGKQSLAMRRIGQAKRNGTVIQSPRCEVCDDECETVAHHWRGYDHPFDVWWVCRMCNANLPHHDGRWNIKQARAHILEQKFEKPLRIAITTEKKWFDCTVCDVHFKGGTGTVDYRNGLFLCAYCNDSLVADSVRK